MILYAAATYTPFTARVRLAVYARGLDVQISSVPGKTVKSPEYLAINPFGRIPALVLDDGTAIVESEVILEYFEDQFSQRPLRPASPVDRARARMISRICDFYVMEQGRPLSGQVNPATRDPAIVDATYATLNEALDQLSMFMGPSPYAVGSSLSTADCTIAPMMFVFEIISHALGRPVLRANQTRLADYMAFIVTDPHVARIRKEIHEGWAARLAPAGA